MNLGRNKGQPEPTPMGGGPERAAFEPAEAEPELDETTEPYETTLETLVQAVVDSDALGEKIEQAVTNVLGNELGSMKSVLADIREGALRADTTAPTNGVPESVLDEIHRLGGLLENTMTAIERSIGTAVNRKVSPRPGSAADLAATEAAQSA